MKVKFTLAALALIAAGCSNQELTEAVQEGQDSNARIVTLQATMPETTDQAPATRATYESDRAAVSGVVMKWESQTSSSSALSTAATTTTKTRTLCRAASAKTARWLCSR